MGSPSSSGQPTVWITKIGQLGCVGGGRWSPVHQCSNDFNCEHMVFRARTPISASGNFLSHKDGVGVHTAYLKMERGDYYMKNMKINTIIMTSLGLHFDEAELWLANLKSESFRNFLLYLHKGHAYSRTMAAAQVAIKLKNKRQQRTIEGIFKKVENQH